MWWCSRGRKGGVNARKHQINVVFLLCFLALFCVGPLSAKTATTERSLSAKEMEFTTLGVSEQFIIKNDQNPDGIRTMGNPDFSSDEINKPNPIRSTSLSSESDTNRSTVPEDERYQVAVFDWERVQTPMLLGLTVLACTLAKLAFHFHQKLSSFCPEPCLLILIGIIIGLILLAIGARNFHLDSTIFFFYMIPPIILDAGYFIPNRTFFDNIGTIILYAIIGTIISTLLLGFSLWGISQSSLMSFRLDVLECLGFAALICAVDPMSVLSVFEEVHFTECLYIIVFGESLLNNGIAVVLYQMFTGLTDIGVEHLIGRDMVAAVGSFLVVTSCGSVSGVLFGFLASLLTRISDHVPVIQPLIVIIVGYLAYVFAEMFHLSGILALTFCGITMRKYVEANMSRKSHTSTKYFLKLLASVSETMIFIYLGITTVINTHQWDWAFCLLTLLFCLVTRAGVVVILTCVVNTSRLPRLNGSDQFILSYGGLRGAIAVCLVLDLTESLAPGGRLYFTTTVLVIMFTNFIMGSTIKPLLDIIQLPRLKEARLSLNDQLHSRLMDHIMAGIEDISGHHGHHELREKFEYLDKHYLQRVFVRQSSSRKAGWTAVRNYSKVGDNDSVEGEHSTMIQHVQSENGSVKNSFLRWLTSVSSGYISNGYPTFGGGGPRLFEPGEQTQVDLQVMESQDTRKMRDDSKVHHIIEDSMFMPRKRFLGHRRHMLPPDGDTQQQLHHKARLHLRHLMSHHRHHDRHHDSHSCNGSVHGNGHNNGRPKKNVSFAEVTQVTKDEGDTDMGSTRAESGASDDESGSDVGGITFTVHSTADQQDCPDEAENVVPAEPVAVEMSLPWKRNTGRDPLCSVVTHSMQDDQHPLIGEAPSWVNNTEYTSPGSPPATPEVQHHILPPPPPPAPSQPTPLAHDDIDLIELDTPDHKPQPQGSTPPTHSDHNHERTNATPQADTTENVSCWRDMFTPQESYPIPVPNLAKFAILNNGSNSLSSPSPVSLSPLEPCGPDHLPWHSAAYEKEPVQQSDSYELSESSEHLPWQADSSGSPAPDTPEVNDNEEKLPWKRPCMSMPICLDKAQLPWRQNSCPTETVKEAERRMLPWKQLSLDSSDETSSLPTARKRASRDVSEGGGLPPPWRNSSQASLPVKNTSPLPWKANGDVGVLPWRDQSYVEVKLDQCAPRPPRTPSPEVVEEQSHVPPPPWRCNPEPDHSVRSPSASCDPDMYSLKPQLSSHSFRISEAESKHSEPVHVPHMIEIPQPRPYIDYDCESTYSLDLDAEEVDLHERVSHWLSLCEPEALQEEDLGITADMSFVNNNLSNPTATLLLDTHNNITTQAETVV